MTNALRLAPPKAADGASAGVITPRKVGTSKFLRARHCGIRRRHGALRNVQPVGCAAMGAAQLFREGASMTYRLYQGDCLDVLRGMPTGSVDVVITDPPYGVELKAKRAKQRGGGVTARVGSYSHDDTPEYIESVVVPAINECRRIAAAVVVTPGIRNMWKYPEPDDVGGFYSGAGTGMGKWGFTCIQHILYYGKDPYLAAMLGSRPNSSGQTYPNDANEVAHPCAKPIRMMNWLVERASLEGMTILDPFMGSGTTGVAAIKARRKFIGIEINPDYCTIAKKRLEEAAAQLSLFSGYVMPEPAQASFFA